MVRSARSHESPVDLRFVDLFLMIVAALVLVTVTVLMRGLGEGAPPRITSKALPVAATGVSYEVPLAATGGAQPLRWEIVGGRLPGGLTMGLDGLIQGSALGEGTEIVRVAVIDAEDRRDERDLAVAVHRAPALVADVPTPVRVPTTAIWLDDVVTGRPYSAMLGAVGGSGQAHWRLADGDVPAGLSLSPSGVLSGVPHVAAIDPWTAPFSAHDRRIERRRVGTKRFGLEATVGAVTERVDVWIYVEPAPSSAVARMLMGDFLATDRGLFRVLSLLVRVLTFAVVGFLGASGGFLLFLYIFGHPGLEVQGWRGLRVRDRQGPSEAVIEGITAPFVIAASRFVIVSRLIFRLVPLSIGWVPGLGRGIMRGIRVAVRRAGTGDEPGAEDVPRGERSRSRGERSEEESAWFRFVEWIFGKRRNERMCLPQPGDGEPASGGFGPPGAGRGAVPPPRASSTLPRPPPMPDEEYLASLRRGGSVKLGGSFLALPLLHELEIESSIGSAFGADAKGRGLLHSSLDEFFRRSAGVSRRAGRQLDERFDVVLSRKGPSPRPLPKADTRQPPATPNGGVQGHLVIPKLAREDAILAAMDEAAQETHERLADLLPEMGTRGRRLRSARGLMRSQATVRLEDDVLYVRLRRPLRPRARREQEVLFEALNDRRAETVGWMRLPVRYGFKAK